VALGQAYLKLFHFPVSRNSISASYLLICYWGGGAVGYEWLRYQAAEFHPTLRIRKCNVQSYCIVLDKIHMPLM
jgi:hypothetical protein